MNCVFVPRQDQRPGRKAEEEGRKEGEGWKQSEGRKKRRKVKCGKGRKMKKER